jgi:uncharacterized protein (DUF362 family)
MTRIAQTTFNRPNLALLAIVLVAGGVVLFAEGYGGSISLAFAVFGAVMAVLAAYFAAFEISTRRLALLAVIAGVGGYLTQVVGATLGGFWSYGPPRHTFYFVPFTFVLASLVAYGLTQAVIGSLIRRVIRRPSRAVNPIIVLAIFALLVVLSGNARAGQGSGFWLYYGAKALICIYLALRMPTATLVAVLLSGALVGAAAELAGSRSGLWTFTQPGGLPPAWLVLGSWPLEVLVHYGLSGVLARESLVARRRYFREPTLYRHLPQHPMWCGDRPHRVISVRGEDKLALLDDALDRADLAGALERRLGETGRSRGALAIAIKPNFMFMYSERDRSTFTDPELVEHLVDWLRARGFVNLTLVEAQSAYGNFFFDRGVRHVAEVVGYDPRGRYRIVDLTEEMVPHHFDGPVGDHFVGPTWRDADFRISFAKNKTHTWAWYTLCLKNIYGTLPLQNKIREYHYKREIYYPAIDMMVAFPVHFGIVDAFIGADGPFGIFADRDPNPTRTVIAGENIVAVDWVGASKMGLDPMVSRYMQLAVQAFGLPTVELVGDGSVYPDWRNVPRPLIEFWDNAEECYGFTNTVFSLLNHEYVSPAFPRRPVSRLYRWVERLVAPIGGLVYQTPPLPHRPHLHGPAETPPSPQHPGSPSHRSSPSHDPASPPPGGTAG